VTEVWRQRGIFELPIQQDVENRIDGMFRFLSIQNLKLIIISEIDRSRVGGKRPALGGSLFSATASSAPPEYQAILTLQATTTKSEAQAQPAATKANTEYDKQIDLSTPVPTPLSMHASQLNSLFQTLANAEGAVAESIKARKALVAGVEKILAKNKEVLSKEEAQLLELNMRKTDIFSKMQAVEAEITRGVSERPDVESITPVGTPQVLAVSTTPGASGGGQAEALAEPVPLALEQVADNGISSDEIDAGYANTTDFLPGLRKSPTDIDHQDGPMSKKVKVSAIPHREIAEFEGDGMELDADVEALLGEA
jgi:regulator of Ty1 transposition protein 103